MSTVEHKRGLRAVALFEAGKGALVLLAGCGLLALVHRDVEAVAEQLLLHLHLNPANHYPRIFLNAMKAVTDARLWFLAVAGFAYAAVRFIEAYGLWGMRRWAAWFGAITGGIYIPFEVFELIQGVTRLKIGALLINIIVVVYLINTLKREHVHPGPEAGPNGGIT
jgi:uncharacterized membrane protein (DUF2068 family)